MAPPQQLSQDAQEALLERIAQKAADKAAKDLYALYEKANGSMVELFGLAEEAVAHVVARELLAFDIAEEVRKRYFERWNVDNAEAIAHYNARIEREGTLSQRIQKHLSAHSESEETPR